MKYGLILILIFFLLGFNGSRGQSPSPDSLAYTVFLLGDAGEVNPAQKRILEILKQQLAEAGEKSTLVFLGDNLYPHGMPPSYSLEREVSETIINTQLDLVKDYRGKYYFISGNHDWAQGRSYGWSYLQNEENYIEENSDGRNVFLPDNGCPGPFEVSLNEDITMIVIDTQWFLHGWDKPDELQGNCLTGNPIEVMQLLNDYILRNANKHLIIATHHPMYTYGGHGGFNTLKDHVFPLTDLVPALYVPLPGLGSIYPLFRKIFGNIQDLSHPTYRNMRNSIVSILEKYPPMIHVAGHEHNLQYSYKDSIHYIVSGSGAKTSYVRTKGFAEFTKSVHGFARLDFYEGGEIKLEFWGLENEMPPEEPLFSRILMKRPLQPQLTPKEFEYKVDLSDSSVITRASDQYERKGKIGKMLLGENYRAEWTQKLRVPFFDIGREHGGLQIIRRGGGMQTKSLTLQGNGGKQYVLRSVEKYPENAVPEFLRETFAVDLVQDQISASHPYGALVVPYLSEAVGVYHTNPELVYIPDDPRLGIYRQVFANTLALYEERPDEDWSDEASFGNSENIIGTTKLLDELAKDNDNEVDQHFTLKSRLFDLIIGDWDRHDDQWRWATFEKKGEKGKLFRPVPRDRDQAFFVNEGLLPAIVSRRWALPKLEGFDEEVRWTPGFMYNGRYFDRSFLTELAREDWLQIAGELKEELTDAEIEYAIRQWPDSIYRLHGEEIVEKLKARRDKLTEYALEYYLFLAEEVNVVGSDKHEYFSVNRMDNGDVRVTVRKIKDDKNDGIYYDRLFKRGETKAVRLYGLGGEDKFVVTGESKGGIRVRVIGGDDEDVMEDNSHVGGWGRKNVFYDTESGNTFDLNRESKLITSDNPEINRYDRKAFEYDLLMPLITGSYNADDGLFIGGGFKYRNHGFRKEPFNQQHILTGSFAFKTNSYNFKYNGVFTDVLKDWDLSLDLDVKQPDYVNNFFGMGNESDFNEEVDQTEGVDEAIDFYRLHFRAVSSAIGLSKMVGGFARFYVQHDYQAVEVDDPGNASRFITDYNTATNAVNFGIYKHYTGGSVGLTFDKRNDDNLTTAGVFWDNRVTFLKGIHNASKSLFSFNSTLAFYYTLRNPFRITFATRFGAGINKGGYEFYQAQVIDGKSELRGYRKTRFYGDSKFYNNLEVRLKLLSFRTYIFPASLGILVFNDVGRVWLEGETSDRWHHGYGGGLWVSPFNRTVLSLEAGRSTEETLLYVRLGFIF